MDINGKGRFHMGYSCFHTVLLKNTNIEAIVRSGGYVDLLDNVAIRVSDD